MSSNNFISYIWVEDLSAERTLALFNRANQIKTEIQNNSLEASLAGKQIAFLFSEASTRTKMSFQMAAQRLGAQCLIVDDVERSSMSKGESFSDTFWTLNAMGPEMFVIRCGNQDPLLQLSEESRVPILNAGFGNRSHPTQALLDSFTLKQHFGDVRGLKVLFVGDIDHSRVASSNFSLLKSLGATVKTCAPKEFCQNNPDGIENIESLPEAISWCDVYVGLRMQFERHNDGGKNFNSQKFVEKFGLNSAGLKALRKDAVILHPAPVNWGIEFDESVAKDPRLLMWKQMENGVYIRAALMELYLGAHS